MRRSCAAFRMEPTKPFVLKMPWFRLSINGAPWFLEPAAVPLDESSALFPNCNCILVLRRLEFDVWWLMTRLMVCWKATTFNRHETTRTIFVDTFHPSLDDTAPGRFVDTL